MFLGKQPRQRLASSALGINTGGRDGSRVGQIKKRNYDTASMISASLKGRMTSCAGLPRIQESPRMWEFQRQKPG